MDYRDIVSGGSGIHTRNIVWEIGACWIDLPAGRGLSDACHMRSLPLPDGRPTVDEHDVIEKARTLGTEDYRSYLELRAGHQIVRSTWIYPGIDEPVRGTVVVGEIRWAVA